MSKKFLLLGDMGRDADSAQNLAENYAGPLAFGHKSPRPRFT